MNPSSVDWSTLQTILAIARAGSLIGAARIMDVNQATVSRQLGRAEKTLQAKLFDRRQKGLFPTENGLRVIEIAEEIEQKVHAVQIQIQGADDEIDGEIRLSMPLHVMPHGLCADIADFMSANQGVSFKINGTDDLVDFTRREADVVIRVGEQPPNSLWGFKIADARFAFYASDKFLSIWGDQMLQQPETAPIPFIEMGTANRSLDREMFLATFPKANICAVADGLDGVLPMIREGIGAGRLMRGIGSTYPELKTILDCPEEVSRPIWVLTHRDFRNVHRIRQFMEFLRDRFEKRADKY